MEDRGHERGRMAENPRRSSADPTLAKQGEGIGSPALASSGVGSGIHRRALYRGPQSALRTNAVACVGAQGASSRIKPQSISGQPVRNAARLCRLGVCLSARRGPQQPPRRRAASSLPSGLSVAGTIPARPTRRRRCAGTAPARAPRPRRRPRGLRSATATSRSTGSASPSCWDPRYVPGFFEFCVEKLYKVL